MIIENPDNNKKHFFALGSSAVVSSVSVSVIA